MTYDIRGECVSVDQIRAVVKKMMYVSRACVNTGSTGEREGRKGGLEMGVLNIPE